jgi:hypothetical protein
MIRSAVRNVGAAITVAAIGLVPLAASADSVADFYKDKKITLMIGFGAGEAYDAYARTLAHYMPKYLPGSPVFVPQNMPGAGSLNAANAIYNTAPRDGTAFGTVHRFVPLMPLLGVEGPKFDALKFTYIGSRRRHHRRRRRAHHVQCHRLAHARDQAQGGERLSHQPRDQPRHGARRGAGALRRVLRQLEEHPAGMAVAEEDRHPSPTRSVEGPGST